MGWLKKILKVTSSSSTPKFTERCHHRHENSEDESSSTEDQDEDDAVIGGYCHGDHDYQHVEDRNRTDDNEGCDNATVPWMYREARDELLDVGFRQSLNIETRPHYTTANYLFQPNPSFPLDCRSWNPYGDVEIYNGQYTSWSSQGYFQCDSSDQQTAYYEFPEAAHRCNCWPSYESPYPPIICDVCKEPVPVDSFGNPEYKEVPIFYQKYCHKHSSDETAKCFSCGRLEPRGTRYTLYNDGRKICGDCRRSAIMDEHDCQPLLDEIHKFYEDLDMKVWQDIPLYMLDQTKMNEGLDGPRSIDGETRTNTGRPAIITIIQTPRFGPDNKAVGIKEKPFVLVSYKQVIMIRLLDGCPRLYTGMVLAHELMHAWLHLEGYHKYDDMEGFCGHMGDIEEGICEVMAHMWIESKIHDMSGNESDSSSEPQFERMLAEHIKKSIETNQDPKYGGGFRSAKRVVNKYGLKETLCFVRLTGNFPE